MKNDHAERKHSKYAASAFERIEACPGSVELSEGLPDKSSPWAEEGTEAHEILEQIMLASRSAGAHRVFYPKFTRNRKYTESQHRDMIMHATHTANFILGMWGDRPGSELKVEEKVYLDFIDEEAFGTLDSSLVEVFETLDIFDFKYGAGHAVSPVGNLQMIFYALAVAHKYDWNFKRIRMWIIQPRIKGYDGPAFWEIPTIELKSYVGRFAAAIARAKEESDVYIEGSHCHWCRAKKICPMKETRKLEKAKSIFTPIGGNDGEEKDDIEKEETRYNRWTDEQALAFLQDEKREEQALRSEADWRKEAKEKGSRRKSRKIIRDIEVDEETGSSDFF